MPSAYDDIDPENPGVKYASEQGVDIGELHTLLVNSEEYLGGAVIRLTQAQVRVLKACIEVACGF